MLKALNIGYVASWLCSDVLTAAFVCGRDRVLLVNVEGIKCMVTTEYVLVFNVDRPMALDFLDELQRRLRQQVRHSGFTPET